MRDDLRGPTRINFQKREQRRWKWGEIHINFNDTKKGGGNSLELRQECGSSDWKG